MCDQKNFEKISRIGAAPQPKIIHFGPGAFFRSFVAPKIDEIMKETGENWGIVAVSINSTEVHDKLLPQSFIYHTLSLEENSQKVTKVCSITEVIIAAKNEERILNYLSSEEIEIIFLTITEKGYNFNAGANSLDFQNEKIIHDLNALEQPKTVIGFIVAGLRKRFLEKKKPFTVVSCDNMQSNGKLTKNLIVDFAKSLDVKLASWIIENVSFPSTVVDRITPATTPKDINYFASEYGIRDEALVVHEPFFQWVIEDTFCSRRPQFEIVGVNMVKNVETHERIKLRCLNGTHSTLAYLGYLAGLKTIADCINEPILKKFTVYLLKNEIVPTLETPEGENLDRYCSALLRRYANTSIEHQTWQIAMDGSQKLPQRILSTVIDLIKLNANFGGLALCVAGWMKYVSGKNFDDRIIDVRDPMVDRFIKIQDSATTDQEYVMSLLKIEEIFPRELTENQKFRSEINKAYNNLSKNKVMGGVDLFLKS